MQPYAKDAHWTYVRDGVKNDNGSKLTARLRTRRLPARIDVTLLCDLSHPILWLKNDFYGFAVHIRGEGDSTGRSTRSNVIRVFLLAPSLPPPSSPSYGSVLDGHMSLNEQNSFGRMSMAVLH